MRAPSRVLLVTDASPSVGLGHVMRSLAIAYEARGRDVPVRYVVPQGSHAKRIVLERGFQAAEYEPGEADALARHVDSRETVIFDGYQYTQRHFDLARSHGARVVVFEDMGVGRFDVDVLVNPNPTSGIDYELPPTVLLLAGPRFAPIRPEFRVHRRKRGGRSSTLLLLSGGSDVARLADRAIELFDGVHLPFARTVVVCGPFARAPQNGLPHVIEVIRDPPDIPELFDTADAVITAAGVTTWELLCMGLPTAVVQVAENQRHVVAATVGAGAALDFGRPEDLPTTLISGIRRLADAKTQTQLSSAALELVDGLGAARILDAALGL